MNHGIFLPVFKYWIKFLNKINCVEWFKNGSAKIFKQTNPRPIKRLAIDIFICLKYLFIILAWKNGIINNLITYIIIYLLFMNFHTYFYYHLWNVKNKQNSMDRMKGRFLTFILAFIYNIVGYGYLYAIPFKKNFQWEDKFSINISAISMSFSKTVGGSLEYVTPITNIGLILSASQIVVTFLFVAVLLGNSLPIFNQEEE
jgi:hypothetical protein